MRYVLIPVKNVTLGAEELLRALEGGELRDGERAAASRTFERIVQTCELLVQYASAIAGKPSMQ